MKRLALLLVVVSGCVSPLKSLRDERPLELEGAHFVVKSNGQPDDVERISRSVGKTPQQLQRWGAIKEPVTVFVVPTHGELEFSVGRLGYDWLRAWARYGEVIFQAPSTWTKSDEVLDELVLHELTHCLMFQASGDRDSWETRKIPLWFREGMALVTARQYRRYPSMEDSARWLETHPGLDPFTDGEQLSRAHFLDVYGVALHAFARLVDVHGDASVVALLAQLFKGATFEDAFQTAMGQTVRDYEAEFRAFLQSRRFRELRKSLPVLELPKPQTSKSTQGLNETTPAQ